jgi:ABC-type Mn2+/Zn2+ transport system permease subunit
MFDAPFMRLALLASLAASVPLGILGVYLAVRRVIFLGLVLSNAAAAGSALAQVMGWPPELASVAAAVGTAVGLGALPVPRHVAAESVMGWAYGAGAAATVLILAGAARADVDTLHLLYGNVLAVSPGHAAGLVILAIAVVLCHLLFGSRFLLVTLDPEGAQVAGVRARLWSLALNLLIGVSAAITVHEIGALVTFALLTLPGMASLLVGRRVQAVFAAAALIAAAAAGVGLMAAFQLDLPPGPASVAVLVLIVPAAGIATRWRG